MPGGVAAFLFRPSWEYFQDVWVLVENSVPAKLKSCSFSIFLHENFTGNRIALSRWRGPHETKAQCLAWRSFNWPPILAVLPSDIWDFCEDASSHQFLRTDLSSQGTWSHLLGGAAQCMVAASKQCPLSTEVKGNMVYPCGSSWRFQFIGNKITGSRGSLQKSSCSPHSMLWFIHSNLYSPL